MTASNLGEEFCHISKNSILPKSFESLSCKTLCLQLLTIGTTSLAFVVEKVKQSIVNLHESSKAKMVVKTV